MWLYIITYCITLFEPVQDSLPKVNRAGSICEGKYTTFNRDSALLVKKDYIQYYENVKLDSVYLKYYRK